VTEWIRSNHNPNSSRQIYGLVLEIICIQDTRLARLLSLCIPHMTAVIFKDKPSFLALEAKFASDPEFSQHIEQLSISLILPYQRRSNNNNINASEIIPDEELLPECSRKGRSIKPEDYGFVGFVVNLVQLRPQHEHLRRTAIWALCNRRMVFKSCDGAWEFREKVVRNRDQCPSISCLDGSRLEANGVRTRPLNLERDPALMFGQLDHQFTNGQTKQLELAIQRAQSAQQKLIQREDLLAQHQQKQQELTKAKEEHGSIIKQLMDKEQELTKALGLQNPYSPIPFDQSNRGRKRSNDTPSNNRDNRSRNG